MVLTVIRSCLVASLLVAACGQDAIGVKPGSTSEDYHHAELVAAVNAFVVAGRTPAAYATLARTVVTLRPGMDKSVADEAELKLVVLALEPMKAVQARPIAEQIAELALTVFPTLLAPPIEADELNSIRDPKAPELVPKPGESASAYLERMCGGVLATDCKRVVPEDQGQVVEALAIRRATERARNAVGDCLTCSSDPGWHQAVLGWEELDRSAVSTIDDVERRADPANWPIAGAASEEDPDLPEAEFTRQGELVIGGHKYGPNQQRIDVLRDLRGNSDVIALHMRPDTTLAEARAILDDARKAGCVRIALIAREGTYPWRRRAYWIAEGAGLRANLRPTDTLQLLVHAIDEVAGPGTVARVD